MEPRALTRWLDNMDFVMSQLSSGLGLCSLMLLWAEISISHFSLIWTSLYISYIHKFSIYLNSLSRERGRKKGRRRERDWESDPFKETSRLKPNLKNGMLSFLPLYWSQSLNLYGGTTQRGEHWKQQSLVTSHKQLLAAVLEGKG